MSDAIYGEPDPTQWALPAGNYILAIGLFEYDESSPTESNLLQRSEAYIQIGSSAEARYYHKQIADLRRRVKKMERASGRLFGHNL